MAGVLLQDGISGGPNPHPKVLGIGAVNAKRGNSDLLPCLPKFRPMFEALPKDASQVTAGVTQVFLEDVECVTVTSVKVRGAPWTIQFPQVIDHNFIDRCALHTKSRCGAERGR